MKLHDIAPQSPLDRLTLAEARIADLEAKHEIAMVCLGDHQEALAILLRLNEELTRRVSFLVDRQHGFVRQRSNN